MTINNVRYVSPTSGTSTNNPSIVEGSTTVGSENTLLIADMSNRELLEGIYLELKKLNFRQQEVFEETVNDGDILCE